MRNKTLIMTISIALLCQNKTQGQTFVRVTQGDVVNNGGSSFGCHWGDYNNDGDLDLFVANRSIESNFLYLNNGNGTFTKITSGEIVNDTAESFGGSWGDFNNDGSLDLFVVNHLGKSFLYPNNGDGTFAKIIGGDIVNDIGVSYSAGWGDTNNDGYLDLLIANAMGDNNHYFINNGNGTFSTITEGSIVNDFADLKSVSWGDYDNDGNLDVFMANGSGGFTVESNNILFRNNGNGTFDRIMSGDLVNDGGDSWSSSWGDYNNDSYIDLFVANRSGQNNFLYKNNGDGTFTKIIEGDITNDGGPSRGSSWGDYDNDGDLDLFVANFTTDNFLYQNNGNGTFTKISTGEIVSDAGRSHGSSWGDIDNDGDLDLFVANDLDMNNFLYLNQSESNNNWIKIKCVGLRSNTSGIGTKVRIMATVFGEAVWQTREISGQTGFGGQNSLYAEFGLGDADIVDSLKIEWSSGIRDNYLAVEVNQFIQANEGRGIGPLSFPPTFSVPDQFVNEDESSEPMDLSNFSNDPDEDILSYELVAVEDTNLIDVTIIDDEMTTTAISPNYFGSAGTVTISTSDGLYRPIESTFSVEILSVDDPPSSFNLFLPTDKAILSQIDSTNFEWKKAIDIDSDLLTYILRIFNTRIDSTFSGISDTSFIFDGNTFLNEDSTYHWTALVTDGTSTIASLDTFSFTVPTVVHVDDDLELRLSFALYQNYPNPFNPSTKISYSIPQSGLVRLKIYNILGKEVQTLVNKQQVAGTYPVDFDGREFPSGVYFYKLYLGTKFVEAKKMLLLK